MFGGLTNITHLSSSYCKNIQPSFYLILQSDSMQTSVSGEEKLKNRNHLLIFFFFLLLF